MKARIDKVNWPCEFPSKPDVEFSLTCSRDTLFLKFTVREEMTIARSRHNFDEVWKDSCCELFIMFDSEDSYYNLETSCNGYQLFSYRKGRDGAEEAGSEIMDMIECTTSLKKHSTFDERHIDEWSLDIRIPSAAFWRSGISDFRSVKARGNVYKCVESLTPQHFLSWAPIKTPAPDFHRPEFFKPFSFED